MDALDAISTRRSIRQYQDRPVPQDLIQKVLAAAMSAPSACNAQPWQFLVIHDRKILKEVTRINSHAAMAEQAPLAVLVCGDLSLEISAGFWVVDCAAAVQNLLLAAHSLGLGAVWTGVWPREDRIDAFRRLLNLPQQVVAHSLIPLGYPAEEPAHEDRYRPDRIHRDGW
jgi:nitroreductase